jgi:hypothetical protein
MSFITYFNQYAVQNLQERINILEAQLAFERANNQSKPFGDPWDNIQLAHSGGSVYHAEIPSVPPGNPHSLSPLNGLEDSLGNLNISKSKSGSLAASTPPASSTPRYKEVVKQFARHQQPAVRQIYQHKQSHPNTPIPASLITAELVEMQGDHAWCLIGTCGIDRAKKKIKPHYDVLKDGSGKKLDGVHDHIRDQHFN